MDDDGDAVDPVFVGADAGVVDGVVDGVVEMVVTLAAGGGGGVAAGLFCSAEEVGGAAGLVSSGTVAVLDVLVGGDGAMLILSAVLELVDDGLFDSEFVPAVGGCDVPVGAPDERLDFATEGAGLPDVSAVDAVELLPLLSAP